jgi:hypothetical protein
MPATRIGGLSRCVGRNDDEQSYVTKRRLFFRSDIVRQYRLFRIACHRGPMFVGTRLTWGN